MWEGNDSDRIVVFNEGEPVTELTIVDKVANAAHRRGQLVFLDPSFEKLLDIVDIETASAELEIYRFLRITTMLVICYGVRSFQRVADRVEVALMHVMAATDVEAIKRQTDFHLLVIDLDLLGRNLHVTIPVLS